MEENSRTYKCVEDTQREGVGVCRKVYALEEEVGSRHILVISLRIIISCPFASLRQK